MLDVKTKVKTTLNGASALTALVPTSRIFVDWPSTFNTLPVVAYREIDNSTNDEDYYNNETVSESSIVQVQVWTTKGVNPTAICQAVDNAMRVAGWNRDYKEDFQDPDTHNLQTVFRFSQRFYQ